MVAMVHTPDTESTKMQTEWMLPSSSQQWLPPSPATPAPAADWFMVRLLELEVLWRVSRVSILPPAPPLL